MFYQILSLSGHQNFTELFKYMSSCIRPKQVRQNPSQVHIKNVKEADSDRNATGLCAFTVEPETSARR